MENKNINVAIGLACAYNQMNIQATSSLIQILTEFAYPRTVFFANDSTIHWARIALAEKAIEMKATHLFFMDTDMNIEANALSKLVAADKDIIGLHFNLKKLPLTTTVRKRNAEGQLAVAKLEAGVFECDAVGAGGMLINMHVFEKVTRPWFFYHEDNLGMTEDVWFCNKAKDAGFSVWCDPTIKVGHWGSFEY